jgi:hypothetical protein
MDIREKVARAIDPEAWALWDKADKWAKAGFQHKSLARTDEVIPAFLEAAAEEGWRIWPDKTTEHLPHAVFLAMDKITCLGDPKARAWDCIVRYRAMLAAAPKFEWDK